jgi:IS30 family transposase
VGLLRQYLPKNVDLARITQRHLDGMAAELNERPRKVLGWDSPAEAYARSSVLQPPIESADHLVGR